MIDTGGTLVKAAKIMKNREQIVFVQFAHTLYYQVSAYDNINQSLIEELIVSDTLPIKKQSSKIKY